MAVRRSSMAKRSCPFDHQGFIVNNRARLPSGYQAAVGLVSPIGKPFSSDSEARAPIRRRSIQTQPAPRESIGG